MCRPVRQGSSLVIGPLLGGSVSAEGEYDLNEPESPDVTSANVGSV